MADRPAAAPSGGALDLPPVTGELAALRDRWSEVVARISTNPATKYLIVSARPVSVADDIVTLGFPEHQAFLREKAEHRRSVLEDGIGAVLGHPVTVRCVATNLDLVPELPPDEDAAFVLAQARRIFGDEAGDGSDGGEVAERGEIG